MALRLRKKVVRHDLPAGRLEYDVHGRPFGAVLSAPQATDGRHRKPRLLGEGRGRGVCFREVLIQRHAINLHELTQYANDKLHNKSWSGG
jgi:hypothetical protein